MPSLVGLGLDEVDKWWANHHKGAMAALGEFARDVLGGQQQGEGTACACMCVGSGENGIVLKLVKDFWKESFLVRYAYGMGLTGWDDTFNQYSISGCIWI